MKLKDIYSEYKAEQEDDYEGLLDSKSWREVWLQVFPHVKLHQYKIVSGIICLLPTYTWLTLLINFIIIIFRQMHDLYEAYQC